MNLNPRSNNKKLVIKNLELIMNSSEYKLAQEDLDLIKTDQMRGVRMLLEVTKPELILDKERILSTVIVFGGASILKEDVMIAEINKTKKKLDIQPKSMDLERKIFRLNNLLKFSKYYDSAREFAGLVSKESQKQSIRSNVIVTGGGPGIMEAANRGAFDANCKSIGLNIRLPKEQFPNAFITPGLCFNFNYFALRKIHFVMRSVAAIFFPGGFGTLDELFELLTLRQTGMKSYIPIILFGKDYWSELINFQLLADSGLISDEDIKLFRFADTAKEAWEIIFEEYKKNNASKD